MVVARGARGRRCRVEARDGLDDADATIENGVVQGASAETGCRVEACLWTSTMRTRQAARRVQWRLAAGVLRLKRRLVALEQPGKGNALAVLRGEMDGARRFRWCRDPEQRGDRAC